MNRRDFLKLSGAALALPFLPFKLANPQTLEQELDIATKGDTLVLSDGIYPISAQILDVRCNLVAAKGARPILVRANGHTPSITFHDDTFISGIWFGGVKDTTVERGWLHFLKRVVFQNNVIWNYYGGIGEGGGDGNIYRRNLFINCGTGQNFHSIYINNSNALHTAYVLENIFIGGQAYHIHLWHNPTNTLISGNFSASAVAVVSLQGIKNVVSNNIWWKPSAPLRPTYMASGAGNVYRRNFHGPLLQASKLNGHPDWFGEWSLPTSVTASENHYYPKTQEADKNPVVIAPGSELTYLGKTEAEIDSAVSGLKTAFSGTVQQIHGDAFVGGHVSLLQSVINKWVGQ